jgi:hypothetical protein
MAIEFIQRTQRGDTMNSPKFLRIKPAIYSLAGRIALLGMTGCAVSPGVLGVRVVLDAPFHVPGLSFQLGIDPAAGPAVEPAVEPAVAPVDAPVQVSSDDQLQQLVAPIALYPDPLLADILPASTFPDQIQTAAQWVQDNPAAADDVVTQQPWDPSVQALAHYPAVLAYMASQIEWTQSLGSAITNEQPDVMATIQDLRTQAMNQGNLVTTSEQVIVNDGDTISIQPADPAVICVPAYDPYLVYHDSVAITFGPRFVTGVWLVHGFNWRDHYLFHGDWHGGWAHGPYGWHRDPYWVRPSAWRRDDRWGRPPFVASEHYHYRPELTRHEWHPVETTHRQQIQTVRSHNALTRPRGSPFVPNNRPVIRPAQVLQHQPVNLKTLEKGKRKNES